MDNQDKTLGTKDTGRRHTKHKNITQETKKMSNTDPTKTRGWTPYTLTKGKQFLSPIRHPPCYSHCQEMLNTTIPKQI